jgi:proteasome assembly chaperone (PAC2) family protein
VEKLEILIEDLPKCLAMGKASRQLAETMSWKKVADDYIHLYEQAVKINENEQVELFYFKYCN